MIGHGIIMNLSTFCATKIVIRRYSNHCFQKLASKIESSFFKAEFDKNTIKSYLDEHAEHLLARKKTALYEKLISMVSLAKHDPVSQQSMNELVNFALEMPNKVHPSIHNYEEDFKVIKTIGSKKEYRFEPWEGTFVLREKDLLKHNGLAPVCGERSYYFTSDAARMEQALIDYTLDVLLSKGFHLVSVPDIVREEMLEGCGMTREESKNRVT